MTRILYLLAGIGLGLTVPVAAHETYIACAPAVQQSWGEACANDNALKSYFEHGGHIPNRCKVS